MYAAKILADSISAERKRLTTFEVTFPRFILAEVNTHRMLSRNSASSRAIPVYKQIQKVIDDPFIPATWPSEQKGMSGGKPLHDDIAEMAKGDWLLARERAVSGAEALVELGVHKSIVNRLLEPFMWHTAILSATEWSNFFALRTDENAQPEFRHIALMMKELYDQNTYLFMKPGAWHLPLVNHTELYMEGDCDWNYWKKVSVGRCARVSYLTHDGVRDPDADVALHDRLMTNGHLSPFEHVATPIREWSSDHGYDDIEWSGNYQGWHQYRKDILNESDFAKVVMQANDSPTA